MPTQNCCVAHDEARVVYFQASPNNMSVAYEVPEGKVFVLTAWTIVNENNQRITVRLRRGEQRVAYNRVWDTTKAFTHLTFPSGIAFGPGMRIELEAPYNSCQHYFYGHEHDVA